MVAAASPAAAEPVPVTLARSPATIRYSLLPDRGILPGVSLHQQRLGRIEQPIVDAVDVRDRFDVRALPFDRLRRETVKAGFQLRMTGDAGGVDTAFDVAGPVSRLMRVFR